MKYALIDWDNTLRRGFTLFTWIEYLCNKGLISPSIHEEINVCFELEKKGEISHGELAKQASQIYANRIKGLSRYEIESCLAEYITVDESHFYGFTSTLFSLLSENSVDAIIVSGSPELIIKQYVKKFNISRVYALVEEEVDGVFNGEVSKNFGYDKERIVGRLYEELGSYPFLSIGDAATDLAMLQAATHGYWIKKGCGRVTDYRFQVFEPNSNQIIKEIESIFKT